MAVRRDRFTRAIDQLAKAYGRRFLIGAGIVAVAVIAGALWFGRSRSAPPPDAIAAADPLPREVATAQFRR